MTYQWQPSPYYHDIMGEEAQLLVTKLAESDGRHIVPEQIIDLRPGYSSPTFLAGPWLGEFGVQLIRWIPYLRGISTMEMRPRIIAGGYINDLPLYRDFASEFWVVPDRLRADLLNQEQHLNDGVFHSIGNNDGFARDARRKGLPDHSELHLSVARGWASVVTRRGLQLHRLVCKLDSLRSHQTLSANSDARFVIGRLLDAAGIGLEERLVLVLPRLRSVQQHTRSWSPNIYLTVVRRIQERGLPVALLGTRLQEAALADVRLGGRVVNAIGYTFDLQLALWERAAVASGPPCGGLVPGYLTNTPLLHWYKPGAFPVRQGVRWNEGPEADYAVLGIRSNWIEVPEAADAVDAVVEKIVSAAQSGEATDVR